jgi:hypothetical protein
VEPRLRRSPRSIVARALLTAWLAVGCSASGGARGGDAGTGDGERSSDPAVLARAAVVIGSCIPDDGVNRNLSHLRSDGDRWWFYGLASAARCIAAGGGGCDALNRCIGWSAARATEPCSNVQCAGDRANGCGDGLRFGLDCSKLGLHCDERRLCSAAPSVSCDATFAMHCAQDGVPEYCASGVVQRGANCPALGLRCEGMDCVGGGEPCETKTRLSAIDMRWDGKACAGADTLLACVGGRSAERACADEGPGFTCQSFGGAFFCGLASECLPAHVPGREQRGSPESCEGDTLVFCNAGRIERISCTDLGFEGCEPRYRTCVPAFADLLNPE